MRDFAYARAATLEQASAAVAGDPDAMLVAGATDVVYLLENEVFAPERLVDISRLPGLTGVEADGGRVRIGALTRMTDAAAHPLVRENFPAVTQSLVAAASGQLRNMATVGGNLLQRTRCDYFRMPGYRCNKRRLGSGCDAIDGLNGILALLGTSEHCIANYPGDFAIALAAFGAQVRTSGPGGDRTIPLVDLHRLPGDTPHVETVLERGEVVVGIDLPLSAAARRSTYLKLRERTSFAFAAASVAAGLELDGGRIADARIALGGVPTKPWRAPDAEAALIGGPATRDAFEAAAEIALRGAVPREHNAWRLPLAKRGVARALEIARDLPWA